MAYGLKACSCHPLRYCLSSPNHGTLESLTMMSARSGHSERGRGEILQSNQATLASKGIQINLPIQLWLKHFRPYRNILWCPGVAVWLEPQTRAISRPRIQRARPLGHFHLYLSIYFVSSWYFRRRFLHLTFCLLISVGSNNTSGRSFLLTSATLLIIFSAFVCFPLLINHRADSAKNLEQIKTLN